MELQTINMTTDQLAEFAAAVVGTTLRELGLKPTRAVSDKVYRSQMLEVISRREFDAAIENGTLQIYSEGNRADKFAKCYTTGKEWRTYLKQTRG